jgi:PhoH-like ATPase
MYVLDTNVLLHDPESIFKFNKNTVVIPMIVLEEIDNFKKNQDETGRNSRQFSRVIDTLRKSGDLSKGITLKSGGIIRVDTQGKIEGTQLEGEFTQNKPDYKILATALYCQKTNPNKKVVLVSKDTNLRIKGDILGIEAEDYEHDKIKFDELYSGTIEITVSSNLINEYYTKNELAIQDIPELKGIYPNQYVIMKSIENISQSGIGRYNAKHNKVFPLKVNLKNKNIWGISPKNLEQIFALDLLLDDDIKLVSLLGKAGSGKTLLSVAAGLFKTLDTQTYKKLLVARPIFPLGKDVGYLPGTLEEKLNPWMRPIWDNIDFLFNENSGGSSGSFKDLLEQDMIAVEPLTYIRGRSIPNQFMIIDEAQNLTPHEMKTIITRAGTNTKIVLTGDAYQIDHPYMDSSSNGLSYVVDRVKSLEITGHVTLTKGERSELAELASNVL